MKLDELEALEKAATAGPWSECHAPGSRCTCGLVWCAADYTVALTSFNSDDTGIERPVEHIAADAQFIAAARNMMPKLIAVARAAKAWSDGSGEPSYEVVENLHDVLDELERPMSIPPMATKKERMQRVSVADPNIVRDRYIDAIHEAYDEAMQLTIERTKTRCADVAQEEARKWDLVNLHANEEDDAYEKWARHMAKVARDIEAKIRALESDRKPHETPENT